GRKLDRALARHGAESDVAVVLTDVGERLDPVEIDQRGRPRQPEVQQRDEALPARQQLRLAVVAHEQRDSLVERDGCVVFEPRRFHWSGVREAGLGRGWPALDAGWLRSTAPSLRAFVRRVAVIPWIRPWPVRFERAPTDRSVSWAAW